MKLLQSTILAAVAAGALLLAVAAPAEAFTLSAPAASDVSPNVDHVWWDRWGHWHPNRPWGWGGPGPYWGWRHRHCWINPWGVRVCRW